MALLAVRSIGKNFVNNGILVSILADISLTLGENEIIAILGASGCGKTTLLRIMAGLEQPDTGEIISPLVRPGPQLGYQSQNDHLLPWRSVEGNVALGPELTGMQAATAHIHAEVMLQQVGLGAFGNSYPRALSGGMTQRALLARKLALSPKLLLLDEPMSNLDIIARQELGTTIKAYVKNSKAGAVIVTHSVEEACQISDKVMVISQKPARILEEITLDDSNREIRVIDVHRALVGSIRGHA